MDRRDLLLDFSRSCARHSALEGHDLVPLLVDAAACLLTGTGAAAVRVHDVPANGEDLLLVYEVALPDALDAAGLRATADEASRPGAIAIALRGVEGPVGTVYLEPPDGEWRDGAEQLAGEVVDALAITIRRHWREVQHKSRADALREAQARTHVGCFEWDIVTNKVRWSDELFRIYGCEPQSFEPTFEEFLERIHPDDRDAIRASVFEAYEERRDYRIEERILRPDGTMRLLSSWGHVITDENAEPVKIIGSCQDVTDHRRAMDELAATESRLAEVRERRAQALELNDNVVQGLAVASYALQLGLKADAADAIEGTLAAARAMIDQGLALGERMDSGSLVRDHAAPSFLPQRERPPVHRVDRDRTIRVVVVDDSEDIRVLVGYSLSVDGRFAVVGEAADGLGAIVEVGKHRPDVLLLDLAMPVLDGLDAIPRVRELSPETRIVVLSGFNASTAAAEAMERGAVGFIEKGSVDLSLGDVLCDIVDRAADALPLIVSAGS